MATVELDPDQTLYFIPESVGPRLAPWRSGSQHRVWYTSAFMPLFRLDPNNEPIPGVALTFDVNEDSTVYTVHLDPDAIFTDGTPVTASDIKELWEYSNQPGDHASHSLNRATVDLGAIKGMAAILEGVGDVADGIVVADDHTIRFEMDQPQVLFPEAMAKYSVGTVKVDQVKTDSDWEMHPIGVGSYTVTFDPDSKDVELNATANWWKEAPTIQKLVQRYSDDAQIRLIMFENFEVDVLFTAPTHHPSVYEPDHPLNELLNWIPSNSFFHYWFSATSPPLDDKNVRAAISYAVDMPRIVQAVFGASGALAESIILPGYKCYDADYKPLRQDIPRAKKLLAESSYGGPENLPTITIGLSASGVQWIRATEAIGAMLEENLGMDINIVVVERGQEKPPEANMFRSSGGAVYDPLSLINRYATRNDAGIAEDNPTLVSMLDELNAAKRADDPTRCDKLRAVDQQFIDNHYVIGAIQRNYMYIVRPWVQGFKSSWNTDFLDLHLMKISKRDN